MIIIGGGGRGRGRERKNREETILELQRLVHRQGQLVVFGVETGVRGQVEWITGTTPSVLDHECFDRATEVENLWDHLHVTSPGE